MRKDANIQNNLDDFYKSKAKGAYIRSRKRWIEKGEQNSAYFFRLEKSKNALATVDQIKVEGKRIEDQRELIVHCY